MSLIRAIGALLMAAALAGCAGSGGVCRPKPISLLSTAFPHSSMPIVPATMNGLQVDVLIDTGAFMSSVAPSVATQLNLPVQADKNVVVAGAGGSMFTSMATVRRFSLGQSRGSRILLPVLALNSHRLPDHRLLGGLIGNDILRYYDLDMDLPGQTIFLVDTNWCGAVVPWGGVLHPVAFHKAEDGAPVVPVSLDGHRMSALIDTGSSATVMSPYLFRASGLAAEHPRLLATHHSVGIGDEKFTVRVYRLATLTIGGVVWHHPIVAVGGRLSEIDDHLVIGDNFTAHHEIYVSNTTGQVFVR